MSAPSVPLPRLFVSIAEAAETIGISRTHAYELVRTGEIPTAAFGAKRRQVPLIWLERLAENTAASE